MPPLFLRSRNTQVPVAPFLSKCVRFCSFFVLGTDPNVQKSPVRIFLATRSPFWSALEITTIPSLLCLNPLSLILVCPVAFHADCLSMIQCLPGKLLQQGFGYPCAIISIFSKEYRQPISYRECQQTLNGGLWFHKGRVMAIG